MTQQVHFDQELIKRYDVAGPRYTSYPTAVQFHEGFDAVAYEMFTAASNSELIPKPLSLYVHLPFCHSLCYYCGCTKKITRHPEHGEAYLKHLLHEVEMQGTLFDRDRQVQQLHFGGGTPTFFDDEQITSLMDCMRDHFSLSESGEREFSIELDPRTVDPDRMDRLWELGFNRISLGVQDFEPSVQQAVNRIQSVEETLGLMKHAAKVGFESISVDLIYGLPLQTVETFGRTLDTMIEARPDRLAVYNYAHLPQLFRSQRMIREADIPSPETKLELMELTIGKLCDAGYVYIGMDHFALPEDELTLAQRNGKLQRNFQGYSTHRECDLIGLGVSSIGKIGDCYAQNLKTIPTWQAAVGAGELPIWRGLTLGTEDRMRRSIIESIMCHGVLCYPDYEARFGIEFEDHFMPELESLQQLEKDGLIEVDAAGFNVTPSGRLLLRNIAMVFDEYLNRAAQPQRFSRVI
ncbi:MAG: oxygen-independent coproporphyrinogen III oxidase [Xanthomonadales bacterium]|nr:oxygen-independent coproporphyrinogen III oxidase [Xanthomonadales bacterium]NIX12388.1 oxygen-independent coproporphyrinogen III oxidase [Xanthomonadales bacterium]